jgi:hypothetical protein
MNCPDRRFEGQSALYSLQGGERVRAAIQKNPNSESEGKIAARLVMERLFQELFRWQPDQSRAYGSYSCTARPADRYPADKR